MWNLGINLIAGLIIAAITGITAYLYGRMSFSARGLLHKRVRTEAKGQYHFLEGQWYDYYISSFNDTDPPVWMIGSLTLRLLRNSTFRGRFVVEINDSLTLRFSLRGEVRGGWLMYVGVCDDLNDTVSSVIFPNILTGSTLVGLWTGQDNARRLATGPIVISRNPLTVSELNKAVSSARLNFIWPGTPTSFNGQHEG